VTGSSRPAFEVLPAGPSAFLVEVADLAAVLALDAALRRLVDARRSPWDSVVDIVPAARTVLVVVADGSDPGRPAVAVREVVAGLGFAAVGEGSLVGAGSPVREGSPGRQSGDASGPDGGVVEVVVRYDGPDLADVALVTGLDEEEVVSAHTGTVWRVAFGGFAPGFAYLVGGDPRLRVPRLDSPRSTVPAGSVGLAGEFSGVYPRASPGGWRLLGRTDAVLWDPQRDPPALLRPGVTVRFVAGDGG
jgi:allophanate hydrolase subunit 1